MPVVDAPVPFRAAAGGLALLLTMSLAACASSSTAAPSAQVVAKPAPTAKTALSPAALVKSVALVDADFTDGSTVRLYSGGDQVTGQVTMDNCGAMFLSEKHRVARHQTAIIPATGPELMSNEVVAYDSARHAAKALEELRTSVTHCPKGVFLPSSVQGVPDMRYDVSKLSKLAGLPVKDTAVQVFKLSAEGQRKHAYGMVILQRQGTVLDILYMTRLKQLTPGNLAAAQALAQITGKRLAAT